uniref:Radical SAM protein n=1 Tax=candidate division WOR-3 bacterium TaxID=2052148 RepID=A0A7V3NVP2_UNCW3
MMSVHSREGRPAREFYIQWHIVERCNLRCIHCYQNNFSSPDIPDKKILEIANIIDKTLSTWRRKGRVSLTGGEPFLRADLLIKLLDFFESSSNVYWVAILTNGTLISEEDARQLKKYKKLREMQVSLDGGAAESNDAVRGKGTFNRIVETIMMLKRYRFPTSIMFTLQKRNEDQVPRIIELARRLGVDALKIERVTPISKGALDDVWIEPGELKEIYKYISEEKKRLKDSLQIRTSRPLWVLIDENLGGFCPAGFGTLTILHDGTVLPCRRLPIPIGNIFAEGLYEIWYTSEVLWQLRDKKQLKGKCRNCEYLHKCGGCRAIAYAVTGDFMAEDPQCTRHTKEELV